MKYPGWLFFIPFISAQFLVVVLTLDKILEYTLQMHMWIRKARSYVVVDLKMRFAEPHVLQNRRFSDYVRYIAPSRSEFMPVQVLIAVTISANS